MQLIKTFLKDEAVNLFNPSLDSCMVFNWINKKGNSLVTLQPMGETTFMDSEKLLKAVK